MLEKLLDILEEICEDEAIRDDYDVDMFEEDLLDSLAIAELLVAIEEEFGIAISPTKYEKEDIATVNKIMDILETEGK